MKEYIERGELESILHNRYDRLAGLRPDFYAGYMMAFHTIEDDVPTAADVAPVVRCKDCRLRGREECAMFYRCECGEQHTWETDNDFCSWGERRDRDNA